MNLTHLPNSSDAATVGDVIDREGAVIIDNLVPAALLDQVASELEPYMAASEPIDEYLGLSTRRTGGLVGRSPASRELVMHPLILEVMPLVMAGSTRIQLHLTQAIAIGPGQGGQSLHRDQWAFDLFPFPIGYQSMCSCMWALTDFTDENGATRVVPGSHQLTDGVTFEFEDTVPAEMERGSVLLWTGSVYHGGGPNRSSNTRVGIDIAYERGWLRQEENQYLTVPREIAVDLPIDLLRLMGYEYGAYTLGYMDDYRDPIESVKLGAGRPVSDM